MLFYFAGTKKVIFTDQEWELFENRVDEGYDLKPTGRYELWLKIHHPSILKSMA